MELGKGLRLKPWVAMQGDLWGFPQPPDPSGNSVEVNTPLFLQQCDPGYCVSGFHLAPAKINTGNQTPKVFKNQCIYIYTMHTFSCNVFFSSKCIIIFSMSLFSVLPGISCMILKCIPPEIPFRCSLNKTSLCRNFISDAPGKSWKWKLIRKVKHAHLLLSFSCFWYKCLGYCLPRVNFLSRSWCDVHFKIWLA